MGKRSEPETGSEDAPTTVDEDGVVRFWRREPDAEAPASVLEYFPLYRRFRADRDGIEWVRILRTRRMPWTELDHIMLVPYPQDEEVGFLSFVSSSGRGITVFELAGRMEPGSYAYELAKSLIAMRDRYAPPPGIYRVESP